MATLAEKMVEKIETLLLENIGVESINIDGQSIKYRDLKKEYEFWKKKYDKEQGKIKTIGDINIISECD